MSCMHRWVDDERSLQFGMLTDAAHEVMMIKSFFDTEQTDAAEVPALISTFIKHVTELFLKGGCLEVGFTAAMMHHLRAPHTFIVGNCVRTLGSYGGPAEDVIRRCLDRMSCWTRIAIAVVQD